MLKAVAGTEILPISTSQKFLGRWIFVSDKWKLLSLVQQDKSQNKLTSIPLFHKVHCKYLGHTKTFCYIVGRSRHGSMQNCSNFGNISGHVSVALVVSWCPTLGWKLPSTSILMGDSQVSLQPCNCLAMDFPCTVFCASVILQNSINDQRTPIV